MNEFWNSWWAFSFMLSPFLVSLSGMALGIYIACSRDFKGILVALSNSELPKRTSLILGSQDLISRCHLVSSIGGALLLPDRSIRRGLLDREDMRNFPPALRRRLLISTWMVIVGMAWLGLMLALLKLSGVN
ncbi:MULTISPECIES: hypothetical protein [Pseudomonas]|jgi:hypothetical protein|uniref:hypothetical protein n=1 Tax=Pseudomonas TaxID=286 RepID=UPI0004D3AD2D|nr:MULTISPECIES: hypothetical protein [Pseudomonas]KES25111.1 hypothetical protein FG99_03120 [Pseudomonas sp. AAC]MBH3434873.1 hypothetical protein [Pseudomonas citronellolis]OBP09952.1 hypothetical protein BAE52_17400 [Pseudomonas sp. EGD-AKN5]QOF83916.1 hypothetical protein IG194_25705 [Pseudomonas sp. ADPe]WAB90338.1 hypothetical protein OSS47_19605 [Pseudomonas citronellolis]